MRDLINSLSPRQREVMIYVAQHLSSKEIGFLLGLSAATVDSHISAALQRLDIRTRREAVLRMADLGYASGASQPQSSGQESGDHHGGDPRSNRAPLYPQGETSTSDLSAHGRIGHFRGDGGEPQRRAIKSGMARVIVRYLLDGFYISLFFAVMSAVAFGAHWIVIICEDWKIDPVVLLVLKGVSYMLAGLDAIGVVTATGLLTYRFIRAMMQADD